MHQKKFKVTKYIYVIFLIDHTSYFLWLLPPHHVIKCHAESKKNNKYTYCTKYFYACSCCHTVKTSNVSLRQCNSVIGFYNISAVNAVTVVSLVLVLGWRPSCLHKTDQKGAHRSIFGSHQVRRSPLEKQYAGQPK